MKGDIVQTWQQLNASLNQVPDITTATKFQKKFQGLEEKWKIFYSNISLVEFPLFPQSLQKLGFYFLSMVGNNLLENFLLETEFNVFSENSISEKKFLN